jgi:hypothetical protein
MAEQPPWFAATSSEARPEVSPPHSRSSSGADPRKRRANDLAERGEISVQDGAHEIQVPVRIRVWDWIADTRAPQSLVTFDIRALDFRTNAALSVVDQRSGGIRW